MDLTAEQRSVLEHTAHRAAGGMFCGDDPERLGLVDAGLMELAGRKSFVPDPHYRITPAGREALRNERTGCCPMHF